LLLGIQSQEEVIDVQTVTVRAALDDLNEQIDQPLPVVIDDDDIL